MSRLNARCIRVSTLSIAAMHPAVRPVAQPIPRAALAVEQKFAQVTATIKTKGDQRVAQANYQVPSMPSFQGQVEGMCVLLVSMRASGGCRTHAYARARACPHAYPRPVVGMPPPPLLLVTSAAPRCCQEDLCVCSPCELRLRGASALCVLAQPPPPSSHAHTRRWTRTAQLRRAGGGG